jgi:hypothetical protein
MLDRKEFPAIRIVMGCAAAAYVYGKHLDFPAAPAQQVLAIATSASTSTAVVTTFNTTTFAKIDPPPLVPPGDRQQQG